MWEVIPNIDKIARNDLRSIRVVTGHWNLPQVRSFYPLSEAEEVPTPISRPGFSESALKEVAKFQLLQERNLRQGLGLPEEPVDFSQGVLNL